MEDGAFDYYLQFNDSERLRRLQSLRPLYTTWR